MPEQKSRPASCVRGTGGKRYSTRRKSLGATRLHWAEADIQALAEIRQYEKQLKTCPYEKASSRADIKLMLAEAEKINPDAKYSIMNALDAEGKLVE